MPTSPSGPAGVGPDTEPPGTRPGEAAAHQARTVADPTRSATETGGAELLDAVMALASNLDLPQVLDLIVGSACHLTGAKYGALGVLDAPNNADRAELAEFHQRGVDPALQEEIGHFPHGGGVLGVLIDDPRPLRLLEIADHPASIGFPDYHPEMHTFLGVPVRVRGTIFGNLYLSEKEDGSPFSEADERIVLGLAAAAGVAIDNARLFEEARSREAWLAAGARAAADLTDDLGGGATQIAEHALRASRCDRVAVAVPSTVDLDGLLRPPVDHDHFVINGVAGARASVLLDRIISLRSELGRHAASVFAGEPGEAALIRMRVHSRTVGVMALHRPGPAWSSSELDSAQTFADHVALSLEHAANEHNRRRLAVYTDRDRIARDLHDQVIQRIFAVGLGLQSMLRRTPDQDLRQRLGRYVDDLDETIAQIRTTIFSLQHAASTRDRRLRDDILTVVGDAARVLGFDPKITFVGPIDSVVPAQLIEDVLATLRESLANVIRHAQADRVDVLVAVDTAAKTLTVQVEDNGVGIDPDAPPGGGLRNTAARAKAAGGHASVIRRADPGTSFVWVVPLPV